MPCTLPPAIRLCTGAGRRGQNRGQASAFTRLCRPCD